ncbi:hypothetical protein SAMN04487967_1889 [Natronorubrum sediminis]|uniref:Uncharacterized protein n=1 Tax=Natronorubrum sediminis TaxID=640943 RepID=A0A1H6FZ32_9EURY|nr:hypothetical protein [Natronorubrum sediminis]SEH15034.1 hypothetical protein SAMN04487967_1889 [Natronorubrum sediminis]
MTAKNESEVDERIELSDEDNSCFETIEDKAREALKHNDQGQGCDVVVRAHNREYDLDRNVTDHLIRTDEEWIVVRTWTEVGGGMNLSVKDYGETLHLDVPELDRDQVTDRLCSEALDAIEVNQEVGWPVKLFTSLVRNAEEIAAELVTEWQNGAEHLVRERIYDGIAGWTGRTAWTAHEEEAMYIEAERVATQFLDEHVTCDVSDDVEATIHEICRQALSSAVDDHRDRRAPHLDYAAEVVLTE